MIVHRFAVALAAASFALAACSPGNGAEGASNEAKAAKAVALTIVSTNGKHAFQVETAKTPAEQERGLMFRTDIPPNGGMLFAPYPGDGGPPREASFWMKNTPSPLDIIFIRPNGTIARIAENTIPFSEEPIASGEAVSAVLEIPGGRAFDLGITSGDKVTWAGHGQ